MYPAVKCPSCRTEFNLVSTLPNISCPHCDGVWIVSSSDSSFHCVSEFTGGSGGLGEYRIELHPPGTTLCPTCRLIYDSNFEMCPGLIEVGIDRLLNCTVPSLDAYFDYIRREINICPKATAGFVEILLAGYDRGKRAKDYVMKVRNVLEILGFTKLASTVRRHR